MLMKMRRRSQERRAAGNSNSTLGKSRSSLGHSSSNDIASSVSSGFKSECHTGKFAKHGGRDQQPYPSPPAMVGCLLAGMETAQSKVYAASVCLYAALSLPAAGPQLAYTCFWLLPMALVAAGETLFAAAPSSACCSNPRCGNLSAVSAGFALVRDKGCVCGG
jgi:hypothetical protein